MAEASRLESFWKREASKYAERTLPANHPYRSEYAKLLLGLKPKRILEVGSNASQNLLAIHALNPHVELFGCDIAPVMTDKVWNLRGLDIKEASVYNLPYPDDFAADIVFTLGLLMHIPPQSIDRAVSELIRVASRHIVIREDAEILGDGGFQGEPNAVFVHDYTALFGRYRMVYSDVSVHLGYVKRFTGVFTR